MSGYIKGHTAFTPLANHYVKLHHRPYSVHTSNESFCDATALPILPSRRSSFTMSGYITGHTAFTPVTIHYVRLHHNVHTTNDSTMSSYITGHTAFTPVT